MVVIAIGELQVITIIYFCIKQNLRIYLTDAAVDIINDKHRIVGAVSALPYIETSTIDKIFSEYKIVTAHSVATNTDFGDGSLYEYKVQTSPLDSFQGMVLQNILCNQYKISRVAIFATNDLFGTSITMESGDGTYCSIENIATYSMPPYKTDFTDVITKALATSATVYLLFVPPAMAANILEQGYNMGLFRDGIQIFGHEKLASRELFDGFLMPTNIPKIMKGFIAIKYWPDYSLNHTESGQKFVEQYRNYKKKSNLRQ